MQKGIVSSVFWKLFERTGYSVISFVVQIILARLLAPSNFGIVAIMTAFTSIAQVITVNGLNMALVQSNEVDDTDYSTVFWINLIIMTIIYFALFSLAPFIEKFYGYNDFTLLFRVLCLVLIPGAISSPQQARLIKELNFKKLCLCSLSAILISGGLGIAMAMQDFGIWAIIANQLCFSFLNAILLVLISNWKPKAVIDFERLKALFSFGWKLVIGSISSAIYTELQLIVIGKMCNSSTTAFYKKGKGFPQMACDVISQTTQSVMLPIVAKSQENRTEVKHILKESLSISSFIAAPLLLGMLSVGKSLVLTLLGNTWIEVVPFLRVFCILFVLYQLHSVMTQTLNGLGLSDVTLKIQLLLVVLNLLLSTIALIMTKRVILVPIISIAVYFFIIFPIDISYCSKNTGFSFIDFLHSVLPSISIAIIMSVIVTMLGNLNSSPVVLLFIQIVVGISVYILLALITNNSELSLFFSILKKKL